VTEQQQLTRGFLFADLRGYTAFVEKHGDAAGAELLRVYRQLVRETIASSSGAEVRTEGDSFYVTFPSASSAVAGALAILEAAAETSSRDPSSPIAVGIGVHAGETQSTSEGPVGSAVNIAARLAALAAAGEVLVTETVRGLTRTSAPVRYLPRGTRRLKGIAEPVTVFAAVPAGAVPVRSGIPRIRRDRLAVLLAVFLVAVIATAVAIYSNLPAANPRPTATQAAAVTPSSSPIATFSPSASPSPAPSLALAPLVHGDGSRVTLLAGRYRAIDFRPAFDLTLDDGWIFRPDSADPGYIRLELAGRPFSGLTFLHVTQFPTDACANDPPVTASGVGSFTSWLRAQPGLTVGASVARNFGTTGAIQLDIAANDEGACSLGVPPYVSIRPFESSGTCCTGFALNVGEVARAYIFDLSDVIVAAFVVAPTAEEAGILRSKAEPVLSTITFDAP
jgi:class 3 adenylate cyclase